MGVVLDKFKKINIYLTRDDLTMQHRMINIIMSVGVVALFVCLAFDFFVGTGERTYWIIILLIVAFITSFIVANVFNKPNLAGIVLALIANVFLMPILYFAEGGKESAMPLWLVLAALFTFLIVEGKACWLIYGINIALTSFLLMFEYNHPDYVQKMADKKTEYIDYVWGIAFVVLVFGMIFKFQGRVYEKKKEELEQKEDELIRMNLDLEKANEAKSVFLARMSHEIRTPINAVIGMDEMIIRESREKQTVAYANDIMSASRTLLSLINDILDFSKVEEGKLEILPTQYEVGSLVNDLVAIGEITEEEARTHKQRNVITRAIQPGQEHRANADFSHISDILPGDYFFMCSDGVLEQMTDKNLVNILSMDNPDEKKREIIVKVTKDNKDNHTAHIIRVLSVGEGVTTTASPVVGKEPVTAPEPRRKRHFLPVVLTVLLLAAVLAIVLWMRKPSTEGNRPVPSGQQRTEQVYGGSRKGKGRRTDSSRKKTPGRDNNKQNPNRPGYYE